jgi:hypothetical protein
MTVILPEDGSDGGSGVGSGTNAGGSSGSGPSAPTGAPDTPGTPVTPTEPPVNVPAKNVLFIPIMIRVGRYAAPSALPIPIHLDIRPAVPSFALNRSNVPSTLRVVPIPLSLKEGIKTVAALLFKGKVDSFFDVDRELKTVVNFGQDYQPLVTNWMFDPADDTKTKFLVKLYKPLPDEVETKTQVWISRELSPTVVDRIYVNVIPAVPQKVYLRPPNRNVAVDGRSGTGVSGVTMTKLFTTGAFDPIRPTDPVMEEWFNGEIGSAELNVDYSDYRNFVFFGSAVGRLNAFATKMATLENLDTLINAQSASISASGQSVTSSLAYPAVTKYANQRLDVIQSFDPYEQFLYYETGIPYSASLTTNHVQDAVYFNSDATWPKTSGSVQKSSQVVGGTWWKQQLSIAGEYDNENQNYLGNNIPQYVRRDELSAEFVQFLNLVGHQFDVMKLYIDHMTDAYDRDNDPSIGLSQDLVWNVAQSYGIELPNQYAIKNLTDYTIGNSTNSKVYREVAAETWKRFLHNQIFMMKTKGTKTSLRALCNAYGILPSLLQIKESSTAGGGTPLTPFEVYEEQANALQILQNSFITLPWSSMPSASQAIQIRFSTTRTNEAVLLDASGSWALKIIPETKATTFSRATSASFVDNTGIVRLAGPNVLRTQYTGSQPIVLFESASVNIALQSKTFTTTWITPSPASSGSVVMNATGIDGTANGAATFSDTDAVGIQQVFQGISIPTGTQWYYFQYWVQKDSNTTIQPSFFASLNVGGSFMSRRLDLNTSTGAFSVVSAGTPPAFAERVSLSQGGLWWIVELAIQNDGTRNNAQPTVYIAGATAASTRSVVVGHIQVEPNTQMPVNVPSSPIYTTTVPVSRSADIDPLISATATGYARVSGSFVDDGFYIGQQVQASGFATAPLGQIQAVTPTTLTVTQAPAVTASLAGRTLFSVGSNAKLQLVTPLSSSISSSVFALCGGTFYTAMVRKSGSLSELTVKRAEQDQIVEQFYAKGVTGIIGSAFNIPLTMNIGTSGSNFGTPFEGLVDEVRVWAEYPTDTSFDYFVKYPGLYNGNTTTSARDQLLVRLSFNKPKNLGPGNLFVDNESPFIKAAGINPTGSLAHIATSNFPSVPAYPNNMVITTREVARFTPNAASTFTTNKVTVVPPATLRYSSGSNVPVLFRDQSIVPLSKKEEYGQSTNTIGFYFSVTDAINDNIIRSVGNIDLNNYLGDPADLNSGSYAALRTLSDIYWNNYAYNINVNTFVDFVKNLLEPLFKQARQLVPARSKLLTGIVHEPHILERSKIAQKKVKVSAGQYARTSNTQNLEAHPIDATPDLVLSQYAVQTGSLSVPKTTTVTGATGHNYSASLSNATTLKTSTDAPLFLSASYKLIDNAQHVTASFRTFDDYTNLVAYKANALQFLGVTDAQQLSPAQLATYINMLAIFRSGATVRIQSSLDDRDKRMPVVTYDESTSSIGMFSDFTKVEATTYFNNPFGFVATEGIVEQRVNQKIIVNRGTWTTGLNYSRNDFVIQSGSTGAAADGNGLEFLCISPDRTFTSTNPPYIDTRNWQQMTYIPVKTMILKKVTSVSGSITLVNASSSLTPFVGYAPQHYKYTRDKRRGIINHQWMGCLQTDLTTTDGKPAVEITYTAGDILVVRNPGEPIQPDQNQSGPILNVE